MAKKDEAGRPGDRAPLTEYRAKRHRDRTPEPGGADGGSDGGGRRFVIQKHAASSLHYDFRLEADGVLKSWAVPKGPSTDPREKRLAMRTEDHPLDYADFEGVIPRGEYGGGEVIVWDTGEYRPLPGKDGEVTAIADGVERGHVKFWLDGRKLHGGYALTRTGSDRGKERWILVKTADETADRRRDPVGTEPASVRTGRTVEDLAEERGGGAEEER
ncbi:DNA polymerase ligase N-terminal domain-containing protein [Streptomyces sp. SL13]|uniref:DNA polymerase ligase N-terminal domain-containing protein n=1 Tax=Streptantibioticus silvisoli TaxID=2705255 RepID=A0AA90K7V6_9ACTN|nr:DNA polymerase ligase N-terminal domain-containing protein [Streptantibioticus silvisoli]MDI5968742.1 DNA polymerase ligase N-terminal domain-containing protein [Streptantibioticus silvisoli]